MSDDRVWETVPAGKARIDLNFRLSRFRLPPVESALAVGRRALIGSHAMAKALEEMLPGAFCKIDVEHPVVEAIILRKVHLARVPQDQLVPLLLRHAERFMVDSDTLHFDIALEVSVSETLEV
jgi:hypothetical protein